MRKFLHKAKRCLSSDPVNVARRKRYAADPEYRSAYRERALSYGHSLRASSSEVSSYRARIANKARSENFAAYGDVRYLETPLGRKGKLVPCLTVGELAIVLERMPATIRTWAENDFILKPSLMVFGDRGKSFPAYTIGAARLIALAVSHVVVGPSGHLRDAQRAEMQRIQRFNS